MLDNTYLKRLNPNSFPSPCFVTDIDKLKANVAILDQIQVRTGAKILLALKAFAQYKTFKHISKAFNGSLHGCCASSPDEARLAKEEFKGEVHTFAAAYSQNDMHELLDLTDHISFNSFSQWNNFKDTILKHNQLSEKKISCGLRINPEHSEGAADIYNPCSPTSRLGIREKNFRFDELEHIEGLHFHTLCQQGADALARTLESVEKKFGSALKKMKWLNMGGGHHITRSNYDLDLLCSLILKLKAKYNLEIYLEPGEAVALDAGVFISTVLDIIEADMPMAILDCSASCHMPDVLEMPYRPEIIGAKLPEELPFTYRLGGKSCLAGDVIGTYSFAKALQAGDKLVFTDMAIYSMVKTTTFNGLRLPSIAILDNYSHSNAIHNFAYSDFRSRLS